MFNRTGLVATLVLAGTVASLAIGGSPASAGWDPDTCKGWSPYKQRVVLGRQWWGWPEGKHYWWFDKEEDQISSEKVQSFAIPYCKGPLKTSPQDRRRQGSGATF